MEDAFEALLDDLVLGHLVNTTGSWEIPLPRELDSITVQETGVLRGPREKSVEAVTEERDGNSCEVTGKYGRALIRSVRTTNQGIDEKKDECPK